MPNEVHALREHLLEFLRGDGAHVSFAGAIKDFPASLYGTVPDNAEHSAWQIVEHIRIALHDLLDFSTNPEYVELNWPEDYWPKSAEPPSKEAWKHSVTIVERDLKTFADLVVDPKSNLFAKIPWGKGGQTLLREVLLAVDHTSYHIGELVLLRRILRAWKK